MFVHYMYMHGHLRMHYSLEVISLQVDILKLSISLTID